ncbi:hypothetical protein LshimejAT787_2000210 [Lyophyllum shimeji]|uniref:DUF6699 domain-containing protein n=1 Tax=Lyophyllum shimeji TaxID=47721 RepID=A0A9P3UWH8_LYOSH|nr:hypothetical protein LshimejAT787_2000210 [Lyophyllum shimeji]
MVRFATPQSSPSTQPRAPFTLHPLLRYSQHDILPGHCTSLLWDLREAPIKSVRHISVPHMTLTERVLAQHATTPRVPTLRVTCGIFPDDWTIMAYNPEGLTLLDILEAIHDCLQAQLTPAEWDALSSKQRRRISAVFDLRWRVAPVPAKTHSGGILRADCLLSHSLFAGLTLFPSVSDGCVLTLRRPPLWNMSFQRQPSMITHPNLLRRTHQSTSFACGTENGSAIDAAAAEPNDQRDNKEDEEIQHGKAI